MNLNMDVKTLGEKILQLKGDCAKLQNEIFKRKQENDQNTNKNREVLIQREKILKEVSQKANV